MPGPSVDIVVVTYHPGDTITTFLRSAVGADGVQSITVVDNASGDDVAHKAADDAGVAFVQTGRNVGYGAAANRGTLTGSAEWILVSNADIVLEPGAVRALLQIGESDDAIGAVGPRVQEIDGSTYPSARPLPTFFMGAGHALFGKRWPRNPWTRRYRLNLHSSGGEVDAGWLSGSCFLVRRSVWEEVGGFDERYFMFFEDVDLGRRIGLAGYRRVWTPGAVATHLGGHSYRSDPAPMLKAHHESARLYLASVYPHWWQAPLRAATAAGLAARQRAEVAAARRNLATRAD